MDYPNDFETPTFPAGKRIAVSRAMAISSLVVFFLIICSCGLLLWGARSLRIHPFLVSVDEITGQWSVVGHEHEKNTVSAWHTLQEALIGKFAANWFAISQNPAENDARWTKCNIENDCGIENNTVYGDQTCVMSCASSSALMTNFISNVMPKYQFRAEMGEVWHLDTNSMQITPIDPVSSDGGAWQIQGKIISNASGQISIIAYARVARDKKQYPKTMGFYISDFNAYRMN